MMSADREDSYAAIKLAVRIFISVTMLGFGIYAVVIPIGGKTRN